MSTFHLFTLLMYAPRFVVGLFCLLASHVASLFKLLNICSEWHHR